MTIQEVKQDIHTYSVKNFYIFTGLEIEIQNRYCKELAKRHNLTIKRVESVNSIINTLQHKSLFLEHFCYVIRDDNDFISSNKLWEIEKYLKDDMVILLYTDIDKRTAFYKTYCDRIVSFDYLPDLLLVKYIRKATNLTEDNCIKLINICEYDYSRILLEIDKIKHYLDTVDITGDDLDWNYGFEKLLEDKVIYRPPRDAIFDLCKAIMKRDRKLAFECLQDCKDIGESTLAILSVLFTNAVQVLQIQTCDSYDVIKSTGLNAWQIKCAKELAGTYSENKLYRIIALIQKLESSIKLGKVDEEFILDYLMVNIL